MVARRQRARRVDVLVANVDGGRGRPMVTKPSTLDPVPLQLVVEMNLFGTVYSCNAVAPIMKQQRSGKIITVSSVAGTTPSAEGGEARILCCASRGREGAFHIMRKSGVKQVQRSFSLRMVA
jgi:NADP-dependent 3-hydroxy acid dehydrogenase YdfG